ncbi:MAG: 4Fe-4S dicluster domain-containing protein [Chloroflexi bacterium]|nr:MAG: 4Fe-4S dicluster domain-containing protein [Chloroflexota bacterium]
MSITLTIDGQKVTVEEGTTLLNAAAEVGVSIPTICYHPSLTPPAVCRLCSVEVEGRRNLQPACVVPAAEGLVVHTNSDRVRTARRVILELLASTVDLHEAPEIQAMLETYQCNPARFSGGAVRRFEVLVDNPFYVRDYSQCVMCWRCIQVCADDVQYTYALTWGGRGFHSRVATYFEEDMPDTTCVFCGNCVGVCPTGALKGLVEWKEEHEQY